jgi:hypothetical protein
MKLSESVRTLSKGLLVVSLAVPLTAAAATQVSYDEVLFANGDANINSSLLTGQVFMDYNASTDTLSIRLRNTSPDGAINAGTASGGIGGLGFTLPSYAFISLSGNSIQADPSFFAPNTLVGGTQADLNAGWGWGTGSVGSSGALSHSALSGYNAAVGTLNNTLGSSPHNFSGGTSSGGMDFTVQSDAFSAFPGNGYISDVLLINLHIVGSTGASLDSVQEASLVSSIDAGTMALIYGSPTAGGTSRTPTPPVPDGGATLALLGIALGGLELIRRRVGVRK